jgi:hypothetical protein
VAVKFEIGRSSEGSMGDRQEIDREKTDTK